ncbi:DUF3489 domain-containing protein [uncultured Roseibium sp.]|uniref:DUF3489 domain-containing protein n=1 Tax=uncultured Roseibium sp. TaxID=1936171 RepID=UPI002595DF98|nr:DUF3489 domain-containing protein [uncultured Roseibium sp.]
MTLLPDWMSLPGSKKAPTARLDTTPELPRNTELVETTVDGSPPVSTLAANTPGNEPLTPAPRPPAPSVRQLEILNLLDMPNGIRCSVLAEKLGWKLPSVRAAISRLRAAGHDIETLTSSSSGETIYRCRRQTAPQLNIEFES